MSTTLAIRFPLGRYHANPWDRAVNEGASEWPPSPWRLLRALVATWHTRWPDLPAAVLDELLDALADPPSYRTPARLPGHTRHYLPDLDHQKGETGPDRPDPGPVPVRQPRRGTARPLGRRPARRAAAGTRQARRAAALPGPRRVRVRGHGCWTEDPVPDATWWRAGRDAARAGPGCSRPPGPSAGQCWRRARWTSASSRRTLPPGTRWVSYAAGRCSAPQPESAESATIQRARERDPVRGHGPGSAEGHARGPARRRGPPPGRAGAQQGRDPGRPPAAAFSAPTARPPITAMPTGSRFRTGASGARLSGLWSSGCPRGLRTEDVPAVLSMRKMSGRRGGGSEQTGTTSRDSRRSSCCSRRPADRAGRAGTVRPGAAVAKPHPLPAGPAPQAGVARRIPGGRRGRRTRLPAAVPGPAAPGGCPLEHGPAMADRWASEFRRYRMTERMAASPDQAWACGWNSRSRHGTLAARPAQPLRLRHLRAR